MKEHGLYIVKQDFFTIIKDNGGDYDIKSCSKRPIYCCLKDLVIDRLYWAIPTSDYEHRSPEQISKINDYLSKPDNDLRSCYYHIGRTTKKAVYKISSCFPITEQYIDHEYTFRGTHIVLQNTTTIKELSRKLKRILSFESHNPNYFPQRITDIKEYLIKELESTDEHLK